MKTRVWGSHTPATTSLVTLFKPVQVGTSIAAPTSSGPDNPMQVQSHASSHGKGVTDILGTQQARAMRHDNDAYGRPRQSMALSGRPPPDNQVLGVLQTRVGNTALFDKPQLWGDEETVMGRQGLDHDYGGRRDRAGATVLYGRPHHDLDTHEVH
ncbi:hypothetical protein TRIUR3_27397 [Triticum urartu]|uniref:Uncharacterized protein n=1 Tax=Triticum urartu TaxID=4572 RepID=M8A0Y0_TRIUA|nr:hypothetical protein TRIUR3_27397 [Triticum urartu]